MKHQVRSAINFLVEELKRDQSPDGAWRYPFETGIITDCYMIILLRTLEVKDEQYIRELVARILSKQEKNGAWKLFYDEIDGNLSLTIEAYCAIILSGYKEETDLEMQNARNFIIEHGGISNASMFTKVMLSIIGVVDWPKNFLVPVEVVLLPNSFPINYFDFSIYARSNLTPILILASQKFQIKTKLKDLFPERVVEFDFEDERFLGIKEILSKIKEWIDVIKEVPEVLHEKALDKAEKYMLQRIEPDGTFYSYFSSTFYMIYALLARGYSKDHPTIRDAVAGLKRMTCDIDGLPHVQYTTSTVWDTALISYALQESGIDFRQDIIQRANSYLLTKQHQSFGDWAIHNRNTLPGGWGFSDSNTINPDIDDTTASLRALRKFVKKRPLFRHTWDRGLNWILSMQNDDGGWPAFEKNVDKMLLELIPIPQAKYLVLDPSSADLTGRTLEYLGNETTMNKDHKQIKNAVEWLFSNQESNGSWYGRWGICYIYGTWAALTGMKAVGVQDNHPAIKKALKWLLSIQNDDGGWGESCNSDIRKAYVPLGVSTITQTAWALDAIMAFKDKSNIPAIDRGIKYLIDHIDQNDWTTQYPKGQGLAGGFYMHYHSYRYIWPLLTLSKYLKI